MNAVGITDCYALQSSSQLITQNKSGIMRLFLLIVTVSILTLGCAESEKNEMAQITKTQLSSDHTLLPENEWVDIENTPIRNHNTALEDKCVVKRGGRVMKVGKTSEGLLLEYVNPQEIAGGTACPTGTRFVVSRDDFDQMNSSCSQQQELIKDLQGLISENSNLLDSLVPSMLYFGGQEIEGLGWVHVVAPVSNGNVKFSYGDSCVAPSVARVRKIGNYGEFVIFELKRNWSVAGTKCPDGTIFEIEESRFAKIKQGS